MAGEPSWNQAVINCGLGDFDLEDFWLDIYMDQYILFEPWVFFKYLTKYSVDSLWNVNMCLPTETLKNTKNIFFVDLAC